jgi:crotonobetainyl-CoA:carnitine CoA-transferase CaiB-like acyl-CoA transferase
MYGHVRMFGSFVHLSRTPGLASGSAPRLGEHTREILAELGYAPAEVERLISERIAMAAISSTGRIASRVTAA